MVRKWITNPIRPKIGYWTFLVREEEGGYTALAPDLPGCVSVGEDIQEAQRNIQEAVELWLETARSFGDPIPPPSSYGEALEKLEKAVSHVEVDFGPRL